MITIKKNIWTLVQIDHCNKRINIFDTWLDIAISVLPIYKHGIYMYLALSLDIIRNVYQCQPLSIYSIINLMLIIFIGIYNVYHYDDLVFFHKIPVEVDIRASKTGPEYIIH